MLYVHSITSMNLLPWLGLRTLQDLLHSFVQRIPGDLTATLNEITHVLDKYKLQQYIKFKNTLLIPR